MLSNNKYMKYDNIKLFSLKILYDVLWKYISVFILTLLAFFRYI